MNVPVCEIDGCDSAQLLNGHASPTTTAGYYRRGEPTKEQSATQLNVPYSG